MDKLWKKYAGNPVLGGEYGVCFDISMLRECDGSFIMYLSWRDKASCARSVSEDGFSWSAPVTVLAPKRADDGSLLHVNRPSVVKRGDSYHMWFTEQYLPGHGEGRSYIGYAVSRDGISFERISDCVLEASLPWEKVAVMCPHVLWDEEGGVWKMWYSGGEQYEPDAIGFASSYDGINWTKHPGNPIFYADPASEWEKHKVTACQIIRDDCGYTMLYIGFANEDLAEIGCAHSPDGIGNWTRYAGNPIITPTPGGWDSDACYKPFALYDGKRWLLWYNGRSGHVEQIGCAILDSDKLIY